MGDYVRAIVWAMVWNQTWLGWKGSGECWLYLLTDEDIDLIVEILDHWWGTRMTWMLEVMGGARVFGLGSGTAGCSGSAIRLVQTPDEKHWLAVFHRHDGPPLPSRPTRLFAAREVPDMLYLRAHKIAMRNRVAVQSGALSMRAIVASGRPYLERKDGRWTRRLPQHGARGVTP